ncbi:MAG: ABC transporter ATP-binding protein [Bacteroidota bacterium]
MKADILTVKNISKKFTNKETPAVEGVSFDLQQNKILSIFGKSGSGKTTLLKLIAGLLQPDNGTIELSGEIIKGPEEKLVPGHEEIKVVFQDFQLKHKMTVRENIDYTLLAYEKDYRNDRLEKVISMCLLSDIENQFIEELSGGQKQRVAIARALSNEPQLLLMDEPFSNLDLVAKSKLRKAIKNIISESSSSIVFVSHDPEEVLAISDEIIILDNGKALQHDDPAQIYQKPVSLTVAEMFGRLNRVRNNEITYYYRQEAFAITDQNPDFRGTVVETDYLGKYQQVTVEVTDGDQLVLLDYQHEVKTGDKIGFNLTGDYVFKN